MVNIFKMELLTVGELTRTVMRGEEPTSDLSVQVGNQMVLVLAIDFSPRCWAASH